MAGPLDKVARSLSTTLTKKFGQKVVLRTQSTAYTPATRSTSTTDIDRAVWALVQQVRRPDREGTLRTLTTATVPADNLYVEGEFRLPEVQDRVVIDADEIFGDDDNPGWTGGTELKVVGIEEQRANQQVYAYELELER